MSRPVVSRPRRLALNDAVGREVLLGDRPAPLADPLGDGAGDVALVEERRALRAEPLDQVADIGHPDRLADVQQAPVRRIDRARLLCFGDDRLQHLEELPHHGRDLDAVAGGARSGCGELGERHRAEALRADRDPERVAVDAARGCADVELLDRVLGEADLDRLQFPGRAGGVLTRRGDEEVEQVRLAAGCVHQHEAACARPRQLGLGDPRHQHRGDRSVDGIPACAQHIRTRLRGQRVASCHHSLHMWRRYLRGKNSGTTRSSSAPGRGVPAVRRTVGSRSAGTLVRSARRSRRGAERSP